MMTLVGLLTSFFSSIRAFVGLVVPLFAEAADFKQWPNWLKWLVGVVLFGLTCWFLLWAQPKIHVGRFNFEAWLKSRDRIGLTPYFLVAVFVLSVAVSWLAYGLYRLLTTPDDATEFADVRDAWAEAVGKLTRAGLRPTDLPVFLVLGRPSAGLDRLFLASGAQEILRTPGDPRGGAAPHPLRVYAWEQAVFITCPGASGWGQFCHKLSFGDDDVPLTAAEEGGATTDPYKTISIGGGILGSDPHANARFQELTRKATDVGLTPAERAEHRELYEAATAAAAQKRAVTLSEDDRELHLRRLRYLCRLIRDERRPWCPLNGLLVLVPWAATEADETARNGAAILTAELTGVRDELRQRYPTFAMVTDLETAAGFEEFRGGFLPDMLKARLGQKLPLVPRFADGGMWRSPADLIGGATRWIGLNVVPAFVLRFLTLEPRDARQTAAAVALHNRRLYSLMRGVFERGPRLGTILANGVPAAGGTDELGGLPLFGGCYLTATGDSPKQQAFVPGAFAKLIEAQDKVAWAPEAEAEDRRLRRLAAIGWGLTGVLAVLVLAGVVLLVRG